LLAQAPDAEFAARCLVAKADSALEARSYLRAADIYLSLIDYFPDSSWAPYAWFKIGECRLRAAKWIGRGEEHLRQAEAALGDFVAHFPEHSLAGKAREELAEARALRAAHYRKVAEYYLGPARRPASALPYLELIRDELADTPEAAWAEAKIREVLAAEAAPVRGHYRAMPLPGVVAAEPEGGQKSRGEAP